MFSGLLPPETSWLPGSRRPPQVALCPWVLIPRPRPPPPPGQAHTGLAQGGRPVSLPGTMPLTAEKTVTSWSWPLSDLGRATFQKWSPLEGAIRWTTTRMAPPLYPSGTPAATPSSPPPTTDDESTKMASARASGKLKRRHGSSGITDASHPCHLHATLQGQPGEEVTPYWVGGEMEAHRAEGSRTGGTETRKSARSQTRIFRPLQRAPVLTGSL